MYQILSFCHSFHLEYSFNTVLIKCNIFSRKVILKRFDTSGIRSFGNKWHFSLSLFSLSLLYAFFKRRKIEKKGKRENWSWIPYHLIWTAVKNLWIKDVTRWQRALLVTCTLLLSFSSLLLSFSSLFLSIPQLFILSQLDS